MMLNPLFLMWLLLDDEEDSKTITLVHSAYIDGHWASPVNRGNKHYVITGVSFEEKKEFYNAYVAAHNRNDIYFVYIDRLDKFRKYAKEHGYTVEIRDYDNEDWR